MHDHQLLTRRQLLTCGTVGLTGLTLPGLLRTEASSAVSRKVQNVILLQHYGAPSHIDMWDPKPDAPPEIRGEFSTIGTSLSGYRITEIMPNIARICHRLTIVRSMTHRIANHNPGTYLSITGHTPERDVVQVPASPTDWPAFGSAMSKYSPHQNPNVPPFVQIPHVAFDQVYKCPGQWGGLLGKRYDPLIVQGDPNNRNYRVDQLQLPSTLTTERLGSRLDLMRIVDKQVKQAEQHLAHRNMDVFYERAFSILRSPRTRRAFDLSREPAAVRERYGRNKVGQSYLLARRLVESGVRFVTCFNGSNPGDGWDTHADNFVRLKSKLMPSDDLAFTALIEDLHARGLLDSTLVIWAGEFGRKPQIAEAGPTFVGKAGRDHWPSCYTVVLAGGGTKPGFIYSGSDRIAAYPVGNPVTPADMAATLYWSLGIDPRTEMHDQQGRPLPLTTGKPVRELFT